MDVAACHGYWLGTPRQTILRCRQLAGGCGFVQRRIDAVQAGQVAAEHPADGGVCDRGGDMTRLHIDSGASIFDEIDIEESPTGEYVRYEDALLEYKRGWADRDTLCLGSCKEELPNDRP